MFSSHGRTPLVIPRSSSPEKKKKKNVDVVRKERQKNLSILLCTY